jgi:PPOX class probable F420-dependent enzyme
MPPLTDEEIDAFLNRPLIAKLSSLNEDGTIHTVPVWFRYDNGDILVGTQEINRKVRNIQRNPNVTVLIDATEPALQGVIIYGKAELESADIIPKRVFIFENYMPPADAANMAPALAQRWEPAVIRVKPDRMISFDYAKGSLFN